MATAIAHDSQGRWTCSITCHSVGASVVLEPVVDYSLCVGYRAYFESCSSCACERVLEPVLQGHTVARQHAIPASPYAHLIMGMNGDAHNQMFMHNCDTVGATRCHGISLI